MNIKTEKTSQRSFQGQEKNRLQINNRPKTAQYKAFSSNSKLRALTQTDDQNEYSQLAFKSLNKNFPVSELKPFSSFCSIQKLQQKIKSEDYQFNPFATKKRHTMYDKVLFPKQSNNDSKNSTFYQSRTKFKKKKSKCNTMINFGQVRPIDEEEHMVVEFVKEDKEIIKRQRKAFENFNQKIKDQFPQHFEPNYQHQQEKCKSTSCNEGFFKRKKYKVEQKYDLEQNGLSFHSTEPKASNKQNKTVQDTSFCIFAKRINRILSTNQPPRKEDSQSQEKLQKSSVLDMNVVLRQKFRAQSSIMYKKYLRSSFKDKKKAMIEDMSIKFE